VRALGPFLALVLAGAAAARAQDPSPPPPPAPPAVRADDPPPAPPVPPSPEPSPSPEPTVRWKDGVTTFALGKAGLELSNRVQFRWTQQWPDETRQLPGTTEPGQSVGSFRLRNVKTKLEGWIYSERLNVELQMNWAELGDTPADALEDLEFDYELLTGDRLHVKFGQFKVPFSRQQMTSSERQQFTDRSVVANEFGRGRDQGIEVWGLLARERLEWRAGIFNGNGQTKQRNDNRFYQYDARVTFQPWGPHSLAESDLESKDHPIVAVSVNVENSNESGATADLDSARRVLGFDGMLKYRGVFATTEVYARRLTPEELESYRSDGWFAQLGYCFGRRLELAARYGTWDPTAEVPDNDRTELAGVVNWFRNRHALKLQGEVRRVTDEARETADHELRVQLQFFF
jgi:phosphate-selective porin OprO/OprP